MEANLPSVNVMIILLVIVVWGSFCIPGVNGFGVLALTLIVSIAFPPASAIFFVIDVLAIITWFINAPKRKKFRDRMERESRERAAHNKWLREEREYQEYKKNHSSWW